MTKFAIMCFLLSHGPSSPMDIGGGDHRRAAAALAALNDIGTFDHGVEFDPFTGRYQLQHHVDRIALHDACYNRKIEHK